MWRGLLIGSVLSGVNLLVALSAFGMHAEIIVTWAMSTISAVLVTTAIISHVIVSSTQRRYETL